MSKAKLAAFVGGFCGFLIGIYMVAGGAQAATVSSARDCDSNAVIRCGALTVNELQQKTSQAGAMTIFNYFGISQTAINQMDSNAVVGSVSSGGTVTVNGRVVATKAMTAGRLNISGSRAVTKNGVTFFVRPPSVSFRSSPLSAFVVMRNNQFAFAILNSCGNPVMATPVAPAVVKKVTPKPVKPVVVKVVKPAPPTQVQVQTQTQTVVVNNQQPPQAAAQATTSSSAPAQIPNTGPGAVIGLGGLATIGGTIAHSFYQRRFRR